MVSNSKKVSIMLINKKIGNTALENNYNDLHYFKSHTIINNCSLYMLY